MTKKFQYGFTLIELAAVLFVLIALAGLAVPYVMGTSSMALCNATDISMQNIKRVIMERYYLDTSGKFPQDLQGLAANTPSQYNLHYLFSDRNADASRIHKPFDPSSQIGWRGPYLQNGIQLAENPDASFQDNNKVHDPIIAGQTQVLDAWGKPIVVQVNNGAVRLVSAGEGGVLETDITANKTGDDRILYLNTPTPATDINTACN